MVDEKNNVTFHISEQLSLQEKKNYHIKWKILLNFELGIRDQSVLHKEEWRRNSVKKSDITNWTDVCLHNGGKKKKSSSHVENKPR